MNYRILGGVIAAFLISGCAIPQKQNLVQGIKGGVFYQRDMKIEYEGHEGYGTLVLPERIIYDSIEIKAKGRLNLLTFETCHRVIVREDAWDKKGFWGSKKNETSVKYMPNPGIENGRFACPIRLGGYEKKAGRHSWGYIDFRHATMALPAYLRCAGNNTNEVGVGICQSKTGTIQELTFPSEVLHSTKTKCKPMPSPPGRKLFRFKIQKGECIFRFKEAPPNSREFRLTTIGWEGILLRED